MPGVRTVDYPLRLRRGFHERLWIFKDNKSVPLGRAVSIPHDRRFPDDAKALKLLLQPAFIARVWDIPYKETAPLVGSQEGP